MLVDKPQVLPDSLTAICCIYFRYLPNWDPFQAKKSNFEFVLLDAKALEGVKPDIDSFAVHFKAGCNIAAFANLGGDAALVVPCPQSGDPTSYAHLATFVRQAQSTQALE